MDAGLLWWVPLLVVVVVGAKVEEDDQEAQDEDAEEEGRQEPHPGGPLVLLCRRPAARVHRPADGDDLPTEAVGPALFFLAPASAGRGQRRLSVEKGSYRTEGGVKTWNGSLCGRSI